MFEHNNFFNGEKEDVLKVLQIAEKWGYGNLIAHLKHEWAKKLMADGISKETALAATNVSSYPV